MVKDLTVDEQNRLVITGRFREIFRENGDTPGLERLSVETIQRQTSGEEELGSIRLEGAWVLTDTDKLELNLSGTDSRFFGESIIFRGRITKLEAGSIAFRIRKSDTLAGLRTRSIELSGRWHADENNRLSFRVNRSGGRYDVLTLEGKWDTGPNNYITYRFRETVQKTGVKRIHILSLKGWWQIGEGRLVYRLYKEKPGELVFTASVQSRSLRAKEGAVRYQLGITFEDKRKLRTETVIVTVFGRWRLDRDLSVSFWVKFDRARVESARFEVRRAVAEGAYVGLALRGKKGIAPELELIFSRKVLPDTSLFLKLSRFAQENRITGGITVEF